MRSKDSAVEINSFILPLSSLKSNENKVQLSNLSCEKIATC